ncbi:MAG: amidohydrolase family protein [Pseudomonadota bacterium]
MRLFVGLFLLSIMAACSDVEPLRGEEIDLVITNGIVIHLDRDQDAQTEDIAIKDGRIVAVGPDLDETFNAAATYDASGRYLIPGLADLHSHFGNSVLAPEEDDTTEVLARHLYFGNTTILNLGSYQAWPERIDALRNDMAAGVLEGPRLLAVGALITMPGSHPTTTIYSPAVQQKIAAIIANKGTDEAIDLTPLRATTLVSTPDQLDSETRRLGEWGADAIKITVESGPSEFGNDHPQMTPAMIAAAAAVADEYAIPLLCHISSIDELEACLDNGADAAAHGITPTDNEPVPADLETRMADAGFTLIPTAAMFEGWMRYTDDLSLLDQPALQPVLSERERALFGSPQMLEAFASDDAWARSVRRLGAHIKKLHDAGGLIVAGTDTGNPYLFAGLALHEELAFYVKSGLSPREAIATATINAAKFMNAQNEWGAIAPGLAADIIVLEADPVEDIANTQRIIDVIQAGRIVERESLKLQ